MPGRVVRFFKNADTSKLFSEISELTFYPKNLSCHGLKRIISDKISRITKRVLGNLTLLL
jgi:hypothetical protein